MFDIGKIIRAAKPANNVKQISFIVHAIKLTY